MFIDDYTTTRESRSIRRATIWVLLLDALCLIALAGLIWLTCVHFLDTTLPDGIRQIVEWIGRTR